MYNSHKTYRPKALNYFHIFIAILCVVYYTVSVLTYNTQLDAISLLDQKYSRYFLLLCIVIDLIIGVYIRPSTHKLILFFQALSAMLLFAAHLFFIYANFALNDSAISLQSTINIGLILMFVSSVLHLINFWKPTPVEDFSKQINVDEKIFEKIQYDDDE